MIAILGNGFISCPMSSNNQNLQLLSFQKIYIYIYETCGPEAATTRGRHFGYTDTLKHTWKLTGKLIQRKTTGQLQPIRIVHGNSSYTK